VHKQLFLSVARRAVPAGLVVAAALADSSGSRLVALYALLALVPVAAVLGLRVYGELLEQPRTPDEDAPRRLQAILWGLLMVLAIAGAASRAPAIGEGIVPGLATTALIGCLIVLCVEGVVELVAQTRQRPARRPRVTTLEG
jgi:hypothetical protein